MKGYAHGNDVDGPFSQFCTALAVIWKLYMDEAKKMDDTLANEFNSDLDPLLIFVSVFYSCCAAGKMIRLLQRPVSSQPFYRRSSSRSARIFNKIPKTQRIPS
jgi:hypothetical protein